MRDVGDGIALEVAIQAVPDLRTMCRACSVCRDEAKGASRSILEAISASSHLLASATCAVILDPGVKVPVQENLFKFLLIVSLKRFN
jgi:hypothetical protein